MGNYVAFIFNNATNNLSVLSASAETSEEAKAQVKTCVRDFCEVRKVVTAEEYALAKSTSKRGISLADLYYLCK